MGFLKMGRAADKSQDEPALRKSAFRWGGWLVLALIALVAVGVRGMLVKAGLPLLLYEDEPIYYRYALDLGLGEWHSDYFKKPGFFLYFYAFFYFLTYQLGHWLHTDPLFVSWSRYLAAFARDAGVVAITGRWVSILLAGGTVALLGRLGWRLFGWGVGLAAAGWLAGALVHVRISPVVIADIPALFCIVLAACLAIVVYDRGRLRDYLLCATAIALAISFKYNVFTVFFLVAAHLLTIGDVNLQALNHSETETLSESQPKISLASQSNPQNGPKHVSWVRLFAQNPNWLSKLKAPRFWIALLWIPLLFLLLNPMTLLNFAAFRKDIAFEKKHMLMRHVNVITSIEASKSTIKPDTAKPDTTHLNVTTPLQNAQAPLDEKPHSNPKSATGWQWMASFPAIFFRILPKTLGWPLYTLGLIAIPYFLWLGPNRRRVVLGFPLVFLLAVLQFQLINAKYLLPIIVFWVLFAFALLRVLIQRLSTWGKPSILTVPTTTIAFALIALAISLPAWMETLGYVKTYTRLDTRQQAARTLHQLAAPGDAVLLEPDTLTLNPRVIRSGWHLQMIEPVAFEVAIDPTSIPRTKKAASAELLEKAKETERLPRFVLLNLGNAEEKNTASGTHYYEMPYAPRYYARLKTDYRLKTVFAPYPIRLPLQRMRHIGETAGFPALYTWIQDTKGGRKNPGPLLILMERRQVNLSGEDNNRGKTQEANMEGKAQ
jgi:hypothetical protein